jgi:hypothetical protein
VKEFENYVHILGEKWLEIKGVRKCEISGSHGGKYED